LEKKFKFSNGFKLNITMSKKEKNLLLILFVTLLFWISYQFLFIPQLGKLEALKTEKENYEIQLNMMEQIISKDDKLKLEEESLKDNIHEKSKKYYYSIDQPGLMHLLNTIIEGSDLNITSMSFSQPAPLDSESLEEVNVIGVSLPFKGNYNALESFLNALGKSSKKLLVDYLSISRGGEDNVINGQILLSAFSYGNGNTANSDYYYINAYSGYSKSDPFQVFDGFEKAEIMEDNEVYTDEEKRDLVYDLESDEIYFMGTSTDVTGEVAIFNNGKFGKSSIRAEYFISTTYETERAYIVLDHKNIILKYPPQSVGIWAYGYGYSPVTIGMRFQDMDGRKIYLELAKGVNWTGWQFISASPPQDINIYPLTLDRIYFELEPNRDDYGVMLFDQIEADYPSNKKNEVLEEHNYIFYVVKPGDTLKTISKKFYNTESYHTKLAKDNALDINDELKAGKVLVISH